jgi:membrane protein
MVEKKELVKQPLNPNVGKFKIFMKVFRGATTNFIDDNGLKLSASLSYYTIFAVAPMILMVMALAGIFLGTEAVQGKIYGQINGLVGNSTALEIQNIIKNIQQTHHTTAGSIVGVVILVLAATGVFTEIQDSINYIWSVKAKPRKGWVKMIFNRLLSFSLIISFGFILLVSLLINAVIDLLSDRLKLYFAGITVSLLYIVNIFLLFLIIATLFAIIFKVLPDARMKWKDTFIGAFFTALLFIVGKFLIGFYLGNSSVSTTYGPAASIVILLLWVYYSSIILFFGAEFTQVYARHYGGGIIPNETAVFIIKKEAKEIELKELR